MSTEIRPIPDDANDEATTNVIATPEGDNEIPPDQPLKPSADAALTGLETPFGSEPDDDYKNDRK